MRIGLGLTALATFSLSLLAGCSGSTGSSTPPPPGVLMTTTVLTATPNPATAGAAVTLTATVTSVNSSSGTTMTPTTTPTGSVSFYDGTTLLGTQTLSAGSGATATAVYTTSTLAAGVTHNLTSTFAGTAGLATSASTAVALAVNAAAPAATTIMLTATPNPAAAGATVTISATISSAAGTPTGSISFLDGSSSLGSVALVNGVATLTTSTLAAGTTHTLTGTYAGNSTFAASTSNSVSLVINAPTNIATTTVLAASPNPATTGATVTLTATVTSSNTTEVPAGSVSFYDGTTLLGAETLTAATADTATAVYTTSSLSAATHSVTASYAGNTTFVASTSAAVSPVINSAITSTETFSFATPNQTIMGFGGAEAFYANYLDSHPNESQIMTALFDPVQGLGITFLRLENNYYNFNGTNATTFDLDNTKILTAATATLGSAPTVLMSSWTPPASLKSNNSVNGCTGVTNGNCTSGFGTLAQVNGAYNYAGFGQFWLSSLEAYAALGVVPNYISIQNEPDFPATYVACLFNPTEAPAQLYQTTESYASYGKAFDATYQAINSSVLASVPKMIGPESFSIPNAQALLTEVPANELAAVAHHLYNVSSYGGNPSNQVSPMTTFDSDYPTQLKFETEYFQTPGFNNAIDIHNALTVANDNVYLYWGLAWPSTLQNGISTDQQGLLYIDNPFNAQSTWAYPNGWTYNDAYYALKGYSYYIRPGYIRYDATSSNADEDVSVYQSPDAKTTVIVILNTSTSTTDTVGLNLSTITYTTSAMYRSSFATAITSPSAERWNSIGAYTTQGITMAPQSEVTVVLTQ
jgi:glucuronoarabinoxylan endo-1,4-beta-xylanase